MTFLEFLGNFNLPLGRWLGIPVRLHWSWLLLFLFLIYINPIFAVAYAAIFFIVVLHEFGHCMAGRYFKVRIDSITLYPFGGAALMVIPDKPIQELVIALAGPLVNLLLIPLLWPLAQLHAILNQIFIANIVLLVFNLLPAFPMDGGRVLRALIQMGTGDRVLSTLWAVRVATAFCILFAIVGCWVFNPILILIAISVYQSGLAELEHCRHVARFGPQISDHEEAARILEETREELRRLEDRRDRNR